MEGDDPFASFLARRSSSDTDGKGRKSDGGSKDNLSKLDPFGTFLARRPSERPASRPDAGGVPALRNASGVPSDVLYSFVSEQPRAVEERLLEEIVRKKRQLLELALQDELQSLQLDSQPPGSPNNLARLQQAEKAAAFLGRTGLGQSRFDVPSALKESASAPSLCGMEMTMLPKLPQLRGTKSEFFPAPMETPPLGRWWSKSRSWNISLDKKLLVARRSDLASAAGAVVFGDGRVPFFTGPHLQLSGYYYAVQIEAVDDENFPVEGCRDLTLAAGVSRLPPGDARCGALYAYEIPGTALAGHGDHFLEDGRWFTTSWSSKGLKVGDILGVLVSAQGDFVVFVNGQQVLRLACGLALGADPAARRALFPVLDLHGRVSAVRLLQHAGPPNAPLEPRNKKYPKVLVKTARAPAQALEATAKPASPKLPGVAAEPRRD